MNRIILPAETISGKIRLPGSKYIANRLLPLCALASTASRLSNVVNNNDINTAIAGLSQLGYLFERVEGELLIQPRQNRLGQAAALYTAHSGTFSRFVTAIAAIEQHPIEITCSDKMATRPMQELFDCLRHLGVTIESPNQCLPVTIHGPIKADTCQLDASRSSQYVSALLMVAPLLANGLTIEITSKQVSRAYIDMTIRLMKLLGVSVVEENNRFSVASGQHYQGIDYSIPGDPVSSTYFMAAAAISGGSLVIQDFDFDSVQGEASFYRVLEQMGATVSVEGNDLHISGPEALQAVEIDMGEMPDAVQTLAAVACFAKGTTRITNIAHLAYKESNRIEDTANEIRKTGIQVESGEDFLTIEGGQPKQAEINTHEDHRMAMSLALLGIKAKGITILNAEVVEKSFPTYWQYLDSIGLASEQL